MKKALAVLILSGSVAPVACAQCTAFLIPPGMRISRDEMGNDAHVSDPKEYLVTIPEAPMTKSGHGAFFVNPNPFAQDFGACDAEQYKRSKKSGLLRLWILNRTGSLGSTWAKESDLVPFTWEMVGRRIEDISANLGNVRRVSALKIDALKNVDFKAPEVESQRTVNGDFDATWAALIETMSDQKWQIESIDKSSGLITTKPATRASETMVCATAFDEDHTAWLNVFVKKLADGTRIKVNATFHALRDGKAITCYSNGNLEKDLFAGIEKSLAESHAQK